MVTFSWSRPGSSASCLVVAAVLLWLSAAHAVSGLVINEIHYDEDDPTIYSEYIELHNAGTAPFDLSGCYFSDGIALTFPSGTVVPPGGFVLICENPAVIQSKWGVGGAGVFSWNAGLAIPQYGQMRNSGERIELRSPGGAILDEVDYGRGFPWPTVGDPPNYSIELINPALDNDLGGHWRRSDGSGSDSGPVTYVPTGSSSWSYRKATSEPSFPLPAWRNVDFVEDGSWLLSASGAPFGYGESENTTLTDMRPDPEAVPPVTGYSGIYLRHSFDLEGPVPGALQLRVFNDDGFVAWINGTEVARFGPPAGVDVAWDAFAGRNHEYQNADVITINAPNAILNTGTPGNPAGNILAIHALNVNFSSSDFYIDAGLSFPGSGSLATPTPMGQNSVFAANAPPAIRQVAHAPVGIEPAPMWPPPDQAVRISALISDPGGMGEVTLAWQVVEPGDYIKLSDPRYNSPASWESKPMSDNGMEGDESAGDGRFSALIPASVQKHRRLIRYRITASDATGLLVTVPYPDDPQPNFAYFVYGSLPSWTGKATPVSASVTYPPAVLESVPAYHLITRTEDHANAQHVPVTGAGGNTITPTSGTYSHSLYNWHGALCYDGKVYDHIRYRARGGVWRFSMGKNMWKFDFNKGHDFQARDNYGQEYDQKWKKLNFSACIQQGDFNHRGEQGLFESVGFRLFQLTGLAAENTQFVHFRIIGRPSETNDSESSFDDDFQGLYLGIEQPDGQFLDSHGLPDGNLYKMEGGSGELNHLGRAGPKNKSDLNQFLSYGTTADWWRANCDLPAYYNYRAIVDGIHHYDIGDGKNYFYYRNPVTSRWMALPWDLDLTWSNNMYRSDNGIAGLSPSGNSTEPFFSRVFGSSQSGSGPIPELRMEMRNRVREIQDLLFNPEQTGMLIDEMASFIYQPGAPSFVDADRALWDYNPIMVSGFVNSGKAGHGRFYRSAVNDPATPENEASSFAGMIVKMKNYVTSRRTVIASQMLTSAEEALVPATPVLTRTGSGPLPVNALTFSSSPFQGREGAAFAGLKWRIAEATDPAAPGYQPYDRTIRRAYEIENAWESEVLTTQPAQLTAPPLVARPGSHYRARVKHLDSTGRWSHWSEPVAFTAAAPDIDIYLNSLVISAFHYHPAAPDPEEALVAPEAGDYEWIELMNVGTGVLDLSPLRFTKGIDFDFASGAIQQLGPGQRVLVVKNAAAFAARYGAGAQDRIAGQWDDGDSLNNAGEQLKLSYGAGTGIRDFVYDDAVPWPEAADGDGYAMVLVRPGTLPDHSNAGYWRLSQNIGGTPGLSDTLTYEAWAAASGVQSADEDSDGDGFINLVEYALGTAADSSASTPLITLETIPGGMIGPSRLSYLRRNAADDAIVTPQWTSDLETWEALSPEFASATSEPQPDGTTKETFQLTNPAAGRPQLFFRLKITSAAPAP